MSIKDKVTEDLKSLNGWERGGVMLAVLFGAILDDEKMGVIETAVGGMYSWHEKQHSNIETCEYCEMLKDMITTAHMIQYFYKFAKEHGAKK